MTWVRLDDQFHRNPKALKMSDAAHRIYVDALSYCGASKDLYGFLSLEEARIFVVGRGKKPTVIDELVNLNAWERLIDGYLIHDWEHHLPPRAQPRVKEWRDSKRIQSAFKPRLEADSSRDIPYPESRSPEPVVINYPSVGSPNAHPTLNMTRLGEHLPKIQRGGQ